jgi:competence protein ComEC
MTFSKAFFYFCIAFLFGVFLASFFIPNFWFYFFILVLGLIIFVVFYKKNIAILGLCFIFLLFGVFWEEKFEREIIPSPNYIHYFNGAGESIIEGTVLKDPQEKEKSNEVVMRVEKVNGNFVKGKLLALLGVEDEVKYGDRVLLKGKIQEPKNFTPDFNYKEYLRARRIYSVVFYPEIKVLSHNKGNYFLSRIFSLKDVLKEKAKILPPPEGAILSAITLGDRSRISDNLNEKLSITGLSHIVAISGMHIMIILEIFFLSFIFLGCWRREATIFSLLILFFYILLIGAPTSAIRAGIMGAFLYFGWMFGRLSQSSRSIVFAATAMVFANPLILTRDVGFQLSFLATLGIIYFYPIFEKKFKAEDSKIKKLICLTLSAQILCLPILVFNFGRIPILAPLSNILIVPLLPALLVFGFSFLILSLIFPFLGLFFSFVCKIIFSWVVFVINLISSLPFSSVVLKIPFFAALVFYLFLSILLIKYKKRNFPFYEKRN